MSGPRTWLPDPSHYPEQLTPLSGTVWFEALGLGLHEAASELRAPFGGFEARLERGWAYEGELEPDWEPDRERMRAAALALGDRWEREYRSEAWALTRALSELRPELPPPDETRALLDRLWELVRAQWRLHFLVVLPAQVAAEIFHDAYVELRGDADPLAPYRLLEAARADVELTELARRARELRVDHLIADLPPRSALHRLRALADGRVWLEALGAYLRPETGRGGRARWHELSLPREAELPQLTLAAVRLALEHDPPEPEPARPVPLELAELHAVCAAAFALKEEHSYHIDYPGLLATREALLGFGRRLVAEGMLGEVEDVWLLTREQLRAGLVDDVDLRGLVARARDDLARGLAEGVRPFLGEPPEDRERYAALEKFYGSGGRALAGAAASPGTAEGTARVVAGPEDFGRVQPGDILVATTTTPAWTPLFPSLAGLVTDTGGILSHAAVVAREYRIPAVVGAEGATRAIPDGARLRLNGDTGAVEILV